MEFGLIGAADAASQVARPKNVSSSSSASGADAAALSASFGAVVDSLSGDGDVDAETGEEIDPPAERPGDGTDEAARKLGDVLGAVGVEVAPALAPVPSPSPVPPILVAPTIEAPAGDAPSGPGSTDLPLDLPLRPTPTGAPDVPETNKQTEDLVDRWRDDAPMFDLPLRGPDAANGDRSAGAENEALKRALEQADRAMSFRTALKLATQSSSTNAGDALRASSLSRSLAEMVTCGFASQALRSEGGITSTVPVPAIAASAAALAQHALSSAFASIRSTERLPSLQADGPSASTAMQIVQAMRMQWSRGVGEAHITLEPQHFGELTVSLKVEHGLVVARLQAETPVVREWLQANQAALRQSLADHHLTLHRLEITEPPAETRHDERRERPSGEPRDGKAPRRARRDDTGETFDIVV